LAFAGATVPQLPAPQPVVALAVTGALLLKAPRWATAEVAVPHPHPASPCAFLFSSSAQHAPASSLAGPPRHPSASAAGSGPKLALHTPVSGQDQLHPVRRFEVAGERRHHGPDLLEFSGHQERRRAAIAFDTNGIQALFGVPQLAMSVRPDGPATMQVRVVRGVYLASAACARLRYFVSTSPQDRRRRMLLPSAVSKPTGTGANGASGEPSI
jgi:hypothetical protein